MIEITDNLIVSPIATNIQKGKRYSLNSRDDEYFYKEKDSSFIDKLENSKYKGRSDYSSHQFFSSEKKEEFGIE